MFSLTKQQETDLIKRINSCPIGSPMMLLNDQSEPILMFLVDHFPNTSPIVFECTMPEETIERVAKHLINRRKQSANPAITLKIDPKSSAFQATSLMKVFKSLESESILYMAVSLRPRVLESVVKELGAGQGIRIDDDLPIDTLNTVIPQLPVNTFLYLSEHMQLSTIASIAQLVPMSVRVSFLAQNLRIEHATTLASNLKTGRYIFIQQSIIPVTIAQAVAKELHEGAILYCGSSDVSYLRAVASSLNPGALLIFHPSIPFEHVLNASKYMRQGTLLSINSDMDEKQINLLIQALNKKDIGILIDEGTMAPEVYTQLMTAINAREIDSRPEVSQKITRVVSFFNAETQRMTQENTTKADAFFIEQLKLNGSFHTALDVIMRTTSLNQYQILQYFIDKYNKTPTAFHSTLENAVKELGFGFLVNLEGELCNITDTRLLTRLMIARAQSRLLTHLQELEHQVISRDLDSLTLSLN